MVFNATYNNISVISWRSVLLEETQYLEKITDLSQATDKLYHIILYLVHPDWVGFKLTMLVVIDTDCIYRQASTLTFVRLSGTSEN